MDNYSWSMYSIHWYIQSINFQKPRPILVCIPLRLWTKYPPTTHYPSESAGKKLGDKHRSHRLTIKMPILFWLVVWTPLKNISHLGWLFPTEWENKIDVPNHQPVYIEVILFMALKSMASMVWSVTALFRCWCFINSPSFPPKETPKICRISQCWRKHEESRCPGSMSGGYSSHYKLQFLHHLSQTEFHDFHWCSTWFLHGLPIIGQWCSIVWVWHQDQQTSHEPLLAIGLFMLASGQLTLCEVENLPLWIGKSTF